MKTEGFYHPIIKAFMMLAVSWIVFFLIIESTLLGEWLRDNLGFRALFALPFIWPALYLRQIYGQRNKQNQEPRQ